MRRMWLAGALLLCSNTALADHTQNILVIGYWPPSNEMLRPFSTNPAQNPAGWQGQNWEGRGYNIHSYFPEFPGISGPPYGPGTGDFMVDYQSTSADFWRITEELHPVAIISFSRGRAGSNWEIESRSRKYALSDWTPDSIAPQLPTPELPIASEPDLQIRNSSLPTNSVLSAVAGSGLPLSSFIDTTDEFAGNFLSGFLAYHSSWYADLHANPSDPAWCIAGGHIHVGGNTPVDVAASAAQISLRALTGYLDTVVPSPGSAGVALTAGLWTITRRRRS